MGIMRQLITPFYKTRTGKAKDRTVTVKANVTKLYDARAQAREIKQLRKDGILK